jgi:hypothetical protein
MKIILRPAKERSGDRWKTFFYNIFYVKENQEHFLATIFVDDLTELVASPGLISINNSNELTGTLEIKLDE